MLFIPFVFCAFGLRGLAMGAIGEPIVFREEVEWVFTHSILIGQHLVKIYRENHEDGRI